MEIHSDRRYRFAGEPHAVWADLSRVEAYRSWWPWLSHLDAAGFDPGTTWTCTVQPPLPYSLRFTLHLDVVEPPRLVEATIAGDIVGSARLTVEPAGSGESEVRLESLLAPANPFLRTLARIARPVVRFGHDWVLDTGAAQFRRATR